MLAINHLLPRIFFSSSGLVLLVAITWWYLGFVRSQHDIIAQVIVATLFFLILIFLLVILIWSRRLKKACKMSIQTLHMQQAITSNRPEKLVISFKPLALPPLCELNAQIFFNNRTAFDISVNTSGTTSQLRSSEVSFNFPHRGYWAVSKINYELIDNLGLFHYRWQADNSKNNNFIKVQPKSVELKNLPLLSSTYKEGDSLPMPRARRGDYYDFRRYDHSDGSRRILWKIYARTGQLLARQPEESVVPAGIAALYCLALADDDKLAAAFLEYCKLLSEADVQIIASCLGAKTSLVTQIEQLADLINASAFDAGYNITASFAIQYFQTYLKELKQALKGTTIDSLIIFVSERYFKNIESLDLIKQMLAALKLVNINPVFCLLEDKNNTTIASNTTNNPSNKILQSLKNLLIMPAEQKTSDSNMLNNFLQLCRNDKIELQRGNIS